MVHASPQPALTLLLNNTSGTTHGTAPLSYCDSPTLCIQLAQNLYTSALNIDAGANTCASAVHPIRSSRCGQSVGISKKLPLNPQTILLCN